MADNELPFAIKMLLPKALSLIQEQVKAGRLKLTATETNLHYNIVVGISKSNGIVDSKTWEEIKSKLGVQ